MYSWIKTLLFSLRLLAGPDTKIRSGCNGALRSIVGLAGKLLTRTEGVLMPGCCIPSRVGVPSPPRTLSVTFQPPLLMMFRLLAAVGGRGRRSSLLAPAPMVPSTSNRLWPSCTASLYSTIPGQPPSPTGSIPHSQINSSLSSQLIWIIWFFRSSCMQEDPARTPFQVQQPFRQLQVGMEAVQGLILQMQCESVQGLCQGHSTSKV